MAYILEDHKLAEMLAAAKEEGRREAIGDAEPVSYQFQDRGGEWNNFVNKAHYEVLCAMEVGLFALYTPSHPAPC